MARSRRVRQLRTVELEEELCELYNHHTFDEELNEAQRARYGRLVRELNRRDYRFRAHGRGCTCSDCMYLLEQWTESRRRWFPSIDDFPADPR